MPAVDRVPVTFRQVDMGGTLLDLPYPIRERFGKSLFSENVGWAEVWLAERAASPTVWTGTIVEGQLYLDQARKGTQSHARKGAQQRPTLLTTGHYKLWIDAWSRPGEEIYEHDRLTKTDHFGDDELSRWTAPPIPHRRYWQDILVRRPRKDLPALVDVKSRRFHWLYRLSRIVFTLEQLLDAREKNAVLVTRARDLAVYLLSFLGQIEESNTNALMVPMLRDMGRPGSVPVDRAKWPDWRKLREMQIGLSRAYETAENFVRWGVGETDAGVEDHQHLNNVAHLVWRMVNDAGFQSDLTTWEPHLAMQHRSLLARLPALLNRVPMALQGTEVSPGSGDIRATGVAMRYGEAFARTFGRKLVARLASGAPAWMQEEARAPGPAPAPGGAGAAGQGGSAVKWLDGVRKYCWSMLNSMSIFVVQTPADVAALSSALEKADQNVFMALEKEVETYRALGRSDVVQKLLKNRDLLRADEAALRAAAGWSEYGEFEELQAALQKSRGGQPERLADALKRGNPSALYLLDGFEIFVKVLVARKAWQAFREEALKGKPAAARRGSSGSDAFIRSLDAASTILKSTAFKNFLKWTVGHASPRSIGGLEKLLEKGDLAGRWGSFATDLYGAWVYGGDVFSNAYGDKLLEKYMPEDAVTSYGFHLVIWGGKWLNAMGSTVLTRTKLPLGYALQGLGYLGQFIGEFGEASVDLGGLEHKHFDRVHEALTDATREVRNRLTTYGLDVYPAAARQQVMAMESAFKWRGVDRDRYRHRFGLVPAP